MSTFRIESDPHTGEFDNQYPIHLQGLITPQEFAFIIQNSNTFLKKKKSILIWYIVMIVIISILFPGLLVGVVLIFTYTTGYIGIIVSCLFLTAVYMIILFGSIFWIQKQHKKIVDGLKAFLEFHNQQTFIPRGVQILAKSGHFGYNGYGGQIYLDVIVSPNAQRNATHSSTSIPQPVFVQTTPQFSGFNVVPNILQYQRDGNLSGYTHMK